VRHLRPARNGADLKPQRDPHHLRPARPGARRRAAGHHRHHARPPVPEGGADAAADDITAFAAFPVSHWKKIWSTNPLERLNKQIKRRTDVVGVFLNPAALLRLAGAVLVEAHDEWQVVDKRYLSESSMATITTPATPPKEVATLPTAALLASTQPCQPRPDRTRPDHARSHELPCSAGQLERARWAM
jgi:hypothetical protein